MGATRKLTTIPTSMSMTFSGCGYKCAATEVANAILYAAHTPPTVANKYKKRQGAKANKIMEHLESVGHELNPAEATTFRALAARCNYLAQDRADIAYSPKELCSEFAAPNKRSYSKLKRLARYLVAHPQLVYKFPWQAKPLASKFMWVLNLQDANPPAAARSAGLRFMVPTISASGPRLKLQSASAQVRQNYAELVKASQKHWVCNLQPKTYELTSRFTFSRMLRPL